MFKIRDECSNNDEDNNNNTKILEINKVKYLYVSYILFEGNAFSPKCECIQLLFTTNAK